jgi:hypothetical protein
MSCNLAGSDIVSKDGTISISSLKMEFKTESCLNSGDHNGLLIYYTTFNNIALYSSNSVRMYVSECSNNFFNVLPPCNSVWR